MDEMLWRTSPNEFWDEPQYTNGQEATFTRSLDVKFIIVQKNEGSGNVNTATIDSWIQEFNGKIRGSAAIHAFISQVAAPTCLILGKEGLFRKGEKVEGL